MADQRPTIVLRVDLEEKYLARLREECPDAEYVVAADEDAWREARGRAEAVIGGGAPSAEDLAEAQQLRWIQATSAGVEAFMTPELAERDLVLTNFSGIHATNIADHVLAMIFAFARDLKTLFERQRRHEWPEGDNGLTTFEPSSQVLGIVGLGDIGEALAQKAHGLGMRVLALQRHPYNPLPSIERVITGDGLPEMLAEADHIVLCLPLTEATRHIIGREELAQMKRGAYIYNIGRGGLIDQEALLAALRDGTLAGAGLDVTDPEPLPADSPLWDQPNVLVTGHTAAATPLLWDRGIELVIDNVRRFLGDEELRNVVNVKAGY
jgi:phosphoglycerate dehydrogenase-like enzyme